MIKRLLFFVLAYLPLLIIAQDYYKILGLKRDATDKEIRSAYRQLSKKYHPDKNPGDDEAQHKFIEVGEAYEVLSDPEKRSLYDRYGADAFKQGGPGGPGGSGGPGGGFRDPFDIFEQMFGGGGAGGGPGGRHARARGPDMVMKHEISLKDYYNGHTYDFSLMLNDNCDHCGGSGSEDGKVTKCPDCQGRGVIVQVIKMGFMTQQIQQVCNRCGGTGEVIKNPCKVCHGNKVTKKEKEFKITVPAGAPRKYSAVERGGADKSPDADPGDLYFEFSEAAVDNMGYRRRGSNLYRSEVLSLKEAIRGGWSRELDFLDGKKKVKLSRPANKIVQNGEIEVIKGFGMPVFQKKGEFGDLIIDYVVLIPSAIPDRKLRDEL